MYILVRAVPKAREHNVVYGLDHRLSMQFPVIIYHLAVVLTLGITFLPFRSGAERAALSPALGRDAPPGLIKAHVRPLITTKPSLEQASIDCILCILHDCTLADSLDGLDDAKNSSELTGRSIHRLLQIHVTSASTAHFSRCERRA